MGIKLLVGRNRDHGLGVPVNFDEAIPQGGSILVENSIYKVKIPKRMYGVGCPVEHPDN